MTIDRHVAALVRGEDRQPVDLLATVLVDPNLHTDTRLRLHHQIAEILPNADPS